jgi:hypothetical protein
VWRLSRRQRQEDKQRHTGSDAGRGAAPLPHVKRIPGQLIPESANRFDVAKAGEIALDSRGLIDQAGSAASGGAA